MGMGGCVITWIQITLTEDEINQFDLMILSHTHMKGTFLSIISFRISIRKWLNVRRVPTIIIHNIGTLGHYQDPGSHYEM